MNRIVKVIGILTSVIISYNAGKNEAYNEIKNSYIYYNGELQKNTKITSIKESSK